MSCSVNLCDAKGRCVCSATTLTRQANPAQRESDCVSWKTRLWVMEGDEERNDRREYKERWVKAKLSITCFAATLESVHQVTLHFPHSQSNSLSCLWQQSQPRYPALTHACSTQPSAVLYATEGFDGFIICHLGHYATKAQDSGYTSCFVSDTFSCPWLCMMSERADVDNAVI